MANPEHLKILRQGGKQWNKWREEESDIAPDLSGAYLRGMNLRRARLYRANLAAAKLYKANLSGADLGEANLIGADLSDADLRGANLRKARLSGSRLTYADVSRADLREADLGRVDLRRADLSGADLSRAALRGTNLELTLLNGADFTRAQAWETHFVDVDLSAARGLENIRHTGPSTIGIDTVYKSRGKIPEAFLRGCGIPDEFIDFISSMTRRAIEFSSCFISYSHEDKLFARRLHDTLQGRGIRCWLDEKQLLPGDHIRDQVDRGIRLWDKVLLCCSRHSLSSFWVDEKLARPLKKRSAYGRSARRGCWR